jgi:SAM-dependent methyltransferase
MTIADRPQRKSSMAENDRGLLWKGYEGQDYEGFWTGPGKQSLDELERAIASHALPGGDAVVDIGAGFGRMGGCSLGQYRSVHMIEPASNLREIAARTFGDAVRLHEASVYDLPFPDASFDAVLMVRVFHHLGTPETAVKEIHRILKPAGRLVFSFSNNRNLKRIAQYALGRAKSAFTRDTEMYASTLAGHNPRWVEQVLSRGGFEVGERFGVGVVDKIVETIPATSGFLRPSLSISRLLGRLTLAPTQFIVAIKR